MKTQTEEKSPKAEKLDPRSHDRDKALAGLAMMKSLEKKLRPQMTTIYKDNGRTVISATLGKLQELNEYYQKKQQF